MYSKLIQAIEWYDAHIGRQADVPCTMDIMCQRIGKRHRDGCIGRTAPFTAYVRELRSL